MSNANETVLPPLPESSAHHTEARCDYFGRMYLYTAEEMIAYAKQAVLATQGTIANDPSVLNADEAISKAIKLIADGETDEALTILVDLKHASPPSAQPTSNDRELFESCLQNLEPPRTAERLGNGAYADEYVDTIWTGWAAHAARFSWPQVAQPSAESVIDTQWWLVELDQWNNPRLVDGAHANKSGADKALFIITGMGLAKDKTYLSARVDFFDPKPTSNGVNMQALEACKSMVDATPPSVDQHGVRK